MQAVLAAEEEARTTLARARAEAEAVQVNARRQADDLRASAKDAARAEAAAILETAVAAAQRDRQEAHERALRELDNLLRLSPETRETLVTAAVRVLLRSP